MGFSHVVFSPRNRFGVYFSLLTTWNYPPPRMVPSPPPGWTFYFYVRESRTKPAFVTIASWVGCRPNLYPPGNHHIPPLKGSWVLMILFSSSIGGKRDRALEGNCLFWGPLCTPKNNPSAPGELRLGPGVHAAPELPQRTAAVGEADFFLPLAKVVGGYKVGPKVTSYFNGIPLATGRSHKGFHFSRVSYDSEFISGWKKSGGHTPRICGHL